MKLQIAIVQGAVLKGRPLAFSIALVSKNM